MASGQKSWHHGPEPPCATPMWMSDRPLMGFAGNTLRVFAKASAFLTLIHHCAGGEMELTHGRWLAHCHISIEMTLKFKSCPPDPVQVSLRLSTWSPLSHSSASECSWVEVLCEEIFLSLHVHWIFLSMRKSLLSKAPRTFCGDRNALCLHYPIGSHWARGPIEHLKLPLGTEKLNFNFISF